MKKINGLAVLMLVVGMALAPSLVLAADQAGTTAKAHVIKSNFVKKAPKFVASNQAESKLYHIPTCAVAKNIKAENLVGFSSNEAAAKAGYTAHDCVPTKKA